MPSKRLFSFAFLTVTVAIFVAAYFDFDTDLKQEIARSEADLPIKIELTAKACLNRMSQDFISGQLLMLGIESADLQIQAEVFKKNSIGGAVLMTAPADPYDESIIRFKEFAAAFGIPPLLSTDEEGGDVQRFSVLGALPAPSLAALNYNPYSAKKLITEHGEKLKIVGIDMVLGPLADVALANGSVLGTRVFSDNPIEVFSYAKAYIDGWQSAGLISVIKHFPGMGSATANTDFASATTPYLDELVKKDFLPYLKLKSSHPAVMIGNQNVPGWFEGPASLSPTVVSYLRDELGYKNNLIITDALDAQAITNLFSIPEAVVKALVAGNDLALFVIPSADIVTTQNIINLVKNRIEAAIDDGLLNKRQLIESVKRKLDIQKIDPCLLKSN